MTSQAENTKRIAKNTLMLYVRMLFSMLVSLYTSRVVLNTLGVEDYGINNVVGGVVGMLGFLNASMGGATSRFLTFEMGRGDDVKLKQTFSSALIVHIGIALTIFVLAETVGCYFLEYKLVIPEERMSAARIVYQLSIFGAMLGIIQTPYNASIIAHEHMDIYAYVEILNVCLRLLIVYLLVVGNFDKLILYSVLGFSVSVLIMSIYRYYCYRHYSESHFKFVWRTDILRPMLSFSGLDLYGNASVMARTTGINMLLNMFFGPVMNAAAAIATSVQSAVMAFAGNFVTAVRPQIVKQYAKNEYNVMFGILRNSVVLCFLLLSALSIPLMCETHFVLSLWLGIVPEHAATLCVYTLLFNFYACMSTILVTAIHATGNIKRPSLINGSLYLSVVPIAYIVYKNGGAAEFSYQYNVLAVVLGMLSNAWTIHLYIKGFSFRQYFFNVFLKSSVLLIGISFLTYSLHYVMEEGWMRLFSSIVVSSLSLFFLGYYGLLSASARKQTVSFIKDKIWRRS